MTETEFISLYRIHERKLYYYVLGMARNNAMAEDVASRAWEIAWTKKETVTTNPKAWIYQVATMEIKSAYRRSQCAAHPVALTQDHEQIPDPVDFTRAIEQRLEVRRIESRLEEMTRRKRSALFCHMIGNTIEEAAVILDVCEGSAGRLIHHAKQEARELCLVLQIA